MKSNSKTENKRWIKPPLIQNKILKWTIIITFLVYSFLAIRTFEINISRIIRGIPIAKDMILAFAQPDFISRGAQIFQGVLESITMTVVATILGIILSFPLFFGAANNLVPKPIYLLCRGILTILRSLHVVILAILFVIMVGFGPLAGVLTMILNSMGFIGKLMAEDIEDINEETLESIRSTGASWLQLIVYGVWPQVSARFIGVSIYRFDMTFRQSTVIGLVGAGGIGGVLDTAMGRYDYHTAAAILIVIIILVLIGEYVSSSIRRRLT